MSTMTDAMDVDSLRSESSTSAGKMKEPGPRPEKAGAMQRLWDKMYGQDSRACALTREARSMKEDHPSSIFDRIHVLLDDLEKSDEDNMHVKTVNIRAISPPRSVGVVLTSAKFTGNEKPIFAVFANSSRPGFFRMLFPREDLSAAPFYAHRSQGNRSLWSRVQEVFPRVFS